MKEKEKKSGTREWKREEMGREINTTGSKSNHAEMQNIVVQMKDEMGNNPNIQRRH